jgi:hypothetical protein
LAWLRAEESGIGAASSVGREEKGAAAGEEQAGAFEEI